MATGFHNHQTEWRPIEGGKRPMDILAKNTPKDVVLQLDAGTAVEVGVDPVAWIKANPGRIKSIHLKDWGKGEGRGYTVAFGEGDVPWKGILQAAESAGGIEYLPDRAGARRPGRRDRHGQALPGQLQEDAGLIVVPAASFQLSAGLTEAVRSDWRLVTGGCSCWKTLLLREHRRLPRRVERQDVVGLGAGDSIPGDPAGIPGTAMPSTRGFSFSSLRMTSAGTWPSTR